MMVISILYGQGLETGRLRSKSTIRSFHAGAWTGSLRCNARTSLLKVIRNDSHPCLEGSTEIFASLSWISFTLRVSACGGLGSHCLTLGPRMRHSSFQSSRWLGMSTMICNHIQAKKLIFHQWDANQIFDRELSIFKSQVTRHCIMLWKTQRVLQQKHGANLLGILHRLHVGSQRQTPDIPLRVLNVPLKANPF